MEAKDAKEQLFIWSWVRIWFYMHTAKASS